MISQGVNLIENYNYQNKDYCYLSLKAISRDYDLAIDKLPYSLRVLLENAVRNDIKANKEPLGTIQAFSTWLQKKPASIEVNFMPSRILMQDFTGVPAIVDLAAMRSAAKRNGKNPKAINPLIPIDLVIDHSVQVDYYKSANSLAKNIELEFHRNYERYKFLHWGQSNFNHFRIVPPGTGICHQVNLEYLAKIVWQGKVNDKDFLYPDSLFGTDSHTTMINGLGVLGWGVGGIEAEAAMLGQSTSMTLPDVIGVKITGQLNDGVTATDLVLTITQLLRQYGVVDKFVEFFGPGVIHLDVANRATIANMSPEYGATCGFFPIDDNTLEYLEFSGRDEHLVSMVRDYSIMQQLFYNAKDAAEYTDIINLDLTDIQPSVAGPKRPQDRINLSEVKDNFIKTFNVDLMKTDTNIANGDIVIAAITSCTNTSNPDVMVAAGLMAKKACELGLKTKPWVKTSLAPGSQVASAYLSDGGLQTYLDAMGFNVVGFGCTTCIGNSGPLDASIEKQILDRQLIVASVLSGNRNFEARVHNNVKANYLLSPPLVLAYAIAGTINIDLTIEPLAFTSSGAPVFLKDLWPSKQEIKNYIANFVHKDLFVQKYSTVFDGDANWKNIPEVIKDVYDWDPHSNYVQEPPYFTLGVNNRVNAATATTFDINDAQILALFGDSVTTDHISPAGNIPLNSDAGQYLISLGVKEEDFNSYGSRRGNHEVMMRGTFANKRIKNLLCPGLEGSFTHNNVTNTVTSIYTAAMDYKAHNIPTIIIAGKEYGTGSSRDWAAKGPKLLCVKAIIAESFERIHRSNLVGMGIIPLTFAEDELSNLNITGNELITLKIDSKLTPHSLVECSITRNDEVIEIKLKLELYTENEVEYIKSGSIMHKMLKEV
jgi:aconitate hydratase